MIKMDIRLFGFLSNSRISFEQFHYTTIITITEAGPKQMPTLLSSIIIVMHHQIHATKYYSMYI